MGSDMDDIYYQGWGRAASCQFMAIAVMMFIIHNWVAKEETNNLPGVFLKTIVLCS